MAEAIEPLQPWLGQGSDEQKTNEYLGGFASITEANKAHLELLEKSKGTLKVPDANSSTEEKSAFRKATGVPDAPDGYEFEKPYMPEGMSIDEDMAKWFKEISHRLGLSKEQARIMYSEYGNRRVQGHYATQQTADRAKIAADDAVKQLWGPDYEKNKELIARTITKYGSAELMEHYDKSGDGNNPHVMQAWLKVAQDTSEDGVAVGVGPGGSGEKPRRYENSPGMYKDK